MLIARASHLGDVAQTIPLVHALRDRWPEVQVAWAVEPAFAPLVAPLVDRIVPFLRDGGARAWPRIRREMRAFGPDVAVDAQGNWKSAFVARLSGAARVLGFERSAWQEPIAGRILRIPTAPCAGAPHLVERACALAAALTGAASPPRLDPLLSTDERARGREALAAACPGGARPLLLHPGVESDPRTWPRERHAALAAAAADGLGVRPIVVTGPGEESTGRWLRERVEDDVAAHLVGQRGLRDLVALFAAARDAGGRLVAQDSGPAHLAASVGLPVHLLAGPEDPARTGPWPIADGADSPHRVVAPPASWPGPAGAWAARAMDEISADAALKSVAAAFAG